MKLSLVVQTQGNNRGKVLEIPLAQFVIGRDPQCNLRPASALISKRHCALIQRDGNAFLCDFDSTNGTFLNDKPVKGEVQLNDGDQLKIGPLLFQVKLEADVEVAKPTPVPLTKTPAPAAAKAAAKSSAKYVKPAATAEDDEIAALLLGDDPIGDSSGPIKEGGVPDGSTVMDLTAMKAKEEAAKEGGQTQGGDAAKPAEKSKGGGDTRSAADAILKKYMKRPRN